MHQHRVQPVILAIAVAVLCAVPISSASGQTAADNSKVNARDRSKDAPTADQQKENKTDLELTRSIRRTLMQDKELSTYAHNVKIITQAGQVTLKGPVRSEDEKREVEEKAVAVAGVGHVTNEMSVAAAKH